MEFKTFEIPNHFHLKFNQEITTLGWNILGGGINKIRDIIWREVKNKDLPPELDPKDLLLDSQTLLNASNSVSFMTSGDISKKIIKTYEKNDLKGLIVTTVGLSNALRVGDEPTYQKINTINLFCLINKPLSLEAHLEGLSILTEAKALAMLENNIPSIQSKKQSTGTGTDCFCLGYIGNTTNETYSGKHTEIGSFLGMMAYEALTEGIIEWKNRQK